MKCYEIFCNFTRVYRTIGKCPYELATDLKFKENNMWIELIHLSKQCLCNHHRNTTQSKDLNNPKTRKKHGRNTI